MHGAFDLLTEALSKTTNSALLPPSSPDTLTKLTDLFAAAPWDMGQIGEAATRLSTVDGVLLRDPRRGLDLCPAPGQPGRRRSEGMNARPCGRAIEDSLPAFIDCMDDLVGFLDYHPQPIQDYCVATMTPNKFSHLIVRTPVNVSELPDHEVGQVLPFPVLMGKNLVPEAKAWALYMFVKEITPEMVNQIDAVGKATPHKHNCDEMYLMIGEPGAITFEVMLGDELYEVATPGAVYIPTGTPHAIRPVKATVGMSGGLIPVCLNGDYTTLPV